LNRLKEVHMLPSLEAVNLCVAFSDEKVT